LHALKRSSAPTLSCHFTYCSVASMGHADTKSSTVSSNCLQSLHLLYASIIIIIIIIVVVIKTQSKL